MLVLATWWQNMPCSLAAGVRVRGDDGKGLTHDEDNSPHIDDLHAEVNGHKEEVVERAQEINLGIATKEYNGRANDISEDEHLNFTSIRDMTEDSAALSIIEDMPNNMDEVTQMKNHLVSRASYIGSQARTGRGLVGPGFFPIALKQSAKCLDHRGLTSPGKIHLWSCHNGMQQMWRYDQDNNHLVTFTGLCLNYSVSSGLSVARCVINSDQNFYYNEAQRAFEANGKCLDAHEDYLYQNGGLVFMFNCHYKPNQQWYLGSDPENQVRLCQQKHCDGGGQLWVSFGDWRHMPSEIGNDKLSCAMIGRNVYLEYYKHSKFKEALGLRAGYYGNLGMSVNDNSVSSFKVRLLPEGKVRLCKHSNCVGGDYYASVGYYSKMPSSIGNDQLTKVRTPLGMKITVYQHTYFRGDAYNCGSCDKTIVCSMGKGNDEGSSFKVRNC